uniref:Uncharacterized protein n=1 Tax=Anguilla anguilla TaxID=7936 RepID=A0A0E9XVU9_ANGAN
MLRTFTTCQDRKTSML